MEHRISILFTNHKAKKSYRGCYSVDDIKSGLHRKEANKELNEYEVTSVS